MIATDKNTLREQGVKGHTSRREYGHPINRPVGNQSSGIDALLSRLDKVRRTGHGTYTACCPAHDDRGPSLALRETDGGTILLHCFAGCSVHEIVHAVGMELSGLFPRTESHHRKRDRRPFPAVDILRAIGFEALVVASASRTLLDGQPLTLIDHDRLILAASRIQSAITAGGLVHG